MRFFSFLTLLIIVESVNSHSSNFHFHARRSTGIIKRQLLGLGGDSPSSSASSGGGLLGGLLGGNHPSPSPAPTPSANAATPPKTAPSPSDPLGAVGGLLSPVAPLTSALSPVVSPIESAAAPVLEPIVKAADPVAKPLASVVAPVASVVAPIASPLASVVAPVASAAAPIASPLASVVAPVASIAAPIVSAGASAAGPVISAGAPIVSAGASAAGPIVSAGASAAGPVVSAGAPIVSAGASAAGPIVSAGASAAGPVISAGASAAGSIISAGTSAAGPLASVLTSAAGSVISAGTSAAGPIVTILTSAAGPVTSPLPPLTSLLPLPPFSSLPPPFTSPPPPATSPLPQFTSPVPQFTSQVPQFTSQVPQFTSPTVPQFTSPVPQFTSPTVPSITSPVAPSAVTPFASVVTSILPLPNSVTPSIIPPEIPTVSSNVPDIPSSSSVPLIPIISFPQPSTTTEPTIITNAPLAKTTMSVDSKISFILTITSLALNSPHSTPSISLTNPDQASSTALPASAVPTTSLPLPSGMPARIYPPDRLDSNTDLTGYTFIAILFDLELNWPFVVTSPISSTQIFAYMPIIIATALGIEGSQILTWALQVYIPTSYHTPADADQLGTLWLGYVPTNVVTTLAQEILAKQSKFYTGETDAVAHALAQHVNSGFDILSVSDPNPGGPSSGDGEKSRRDTIIGVVTSLGGIAFFVLVFLAYRMMKNRRDHAHRRLSDPSDRDSPGVRPDGQDFDQDSVGGARRRSFYYAEDSLRGFQDPEQDHFAAGGPSVMTERRTVVPGTPISPPVLQQSSLNW